MDRFELWDFLQGIVWTNFYKIEFFPSRSPRPPRIFKNSQIPRLFRIFSEALKFSKTRNMEMPKERDGGGLGIQNFKR